jgi:GTP cyclohydrolase I
MAIYISAGVTGVSKAFRMVDGISARIRFARVCTQSKAASVIICVEEICEGCSYTCWIRLNGVIAVAYTPKRVVFVPFVSSY